MGVGNIGIGFVGEVESIVATAVRLMFMHNSRHRSLFDIVQYYLIEDEEIWIVHQFNSMMHPVGRLDLARSKLFLIMHNAL